MSFQVNQPRQTGNLPPVFQPAGTQPAPEALFNPANPFGVPAASSESVATSESVAQINSTQGESLAVVNLFGGPSFPTATDLSQPDVTQGLMIFDDLVRRRGQGVDGGTRQPLDYSLAKMTESPSPLEVNQLDQTLQELAQRLQGLGIKEAGPLTADELARFNGTLKTFGLKTDGINLYNLSVRASDPATSQRRPIQVTRTQIDTLRAACAAVRSQFEKDSSPFMRSKLRSIEPSVSDMSPVALRFGVPEKPSQLTDSASIRLRTILLQRNEFEGLLNQGLSFIDESAALIQGLSPQIAQTNQALALAASETGRISTQLANERQTMISLQQVGERLLGQASIQVSTADLPALNRELAGVKLEIQQGENGLPRFLQNGQTISEADFRLALHSSIQAQATTVGQLNAELGHQAQKVEALSAHANNLSQQMQHAISLSKLGLESFAGNKPRMRDALMNLEALRADPAQWAQLSPQEQQQATEMISFLSQGLQKAEQAEGLIKPLVEQGLKDLQAVAEGNQKIEGLLKQVQKQRKEIEALLAAVQQGLDQMAKQLDPTPIQSTEAQPLLNKADELEATLNLAPQPDGAALRKLSESWLNELESNFREFSQLHRTQSTDRENQRQSFDRSIRALREQLTYHEQQLDSMAERSHAQVRQALLDSVVAFKGLAKP